MKNFKAIAAPLAVLALMLGAIALVGLLTSLQLQETGWDPAHHGVPGARLVHDLTL